MRLSLFRILERMIEHGVSKGFELEFYIVAQKILREMYLARVL